MLIYLTNLVLVFFFGQMSYFFSHKKKTNTLGETYIEPAKLFKYLMLASLILTYALRWRTGTDTPGYISAYYSMWQYDIKDILEFNDRVFYFINWIDYRLFSGSLLLHNIVLGVITYCPVFYMYEKYSRDYPKTSAFAILTTFYYFAFNGQRQATAVGICIIAFLLLKQKRYVLCILVLFIAMQVHSTALVMVPILFLTQAKTKSKIFIMVTVVLFLSALFMKNVWDSMFSLLDMLGQDIIVMRYKESESVLLGANVLRFFVVFAPTILGIWKYPILRKKHTDYDEILNLNIMTSVWMLAGTYNWIVARICAYTNPFLPILIIWNSEIFSKKSRKIYLWLVAFLFFIYMIVVIHKDSALLPYYFMNNEHLFY